MQLARVEAEIVRENQGTTWVCWRMVQHRFITEFEAARKQNAEHIERMENLKDELALQNQRYHWKVTPFSDDHCDEINDVLYSIKELLFSSLFVLIHFRLQLDVIELEKEADDREEHSKWMLSRVRRLDAFEVEFR